MIQIESDPMKSDVENILSHKIGIKFSPPTLILIYELKDTKQLKKRLMPIRNFNLDSNIKFFTENLKSRHAEKLSSVPNNQIEKMLKLLKDYNRGIDLQTSLKRLQTQEQLFKLSEIDEEGITSFIGDPDTESDINEQEDDEEEIESPWKKEENIFGWND